MEGICSLCLYTKMLNKLSLYLHRMTDFLFKFEITGSSLGENYDMMDLNTIKVLLDSVKILPDVHINHIHAHYKKVHTLYYLSSHTQDSMCISKTMNNKTNIEMTN